MKISFSFDIGASISVEKMGVPTHYRLITVRWHFGNCECRVWSDSLEFESDHYRPVKYRVQFLDSRL